MNFHIVECICHMRMTIVTAYVVHSGAIFGVCFGYCLVPLFCSALYMMFIWNSQHYYLQNIFVSIFCCRRTSIVSNSYIYIYSPGNALTSIRRALVALPNAMRPRSPTEYGPWKSHATPRDVVMPMCPMNGMSQVTFSLSRCLLAIL